MLSLLPMMAALPPRLIIASCTSLALTGAFAGVSWGLTYIALPGLLLPSPKSSASGSQPATTTAHLARQSQKIYDIGAAVGPAVGVVSASSFIYASTLLPAAATVPRSLFIAAAVLNVSVAPFTFAVMARTNNELHRRAAAAEKGEDENLGRKGAKSGSVESYDTSKLIEWWGVLNAMRGWIQVGAIACATTALVI